MQANPSRTLTADDSGFTLVEAIVAITIFMIFMSVFVAGLVQLSTTTYKATARMESSQMMGIAHQRIDPTIRFAEDINAPGVSGSRVYIEYFTSADATSDVRNVCTQLRYDPDDATIAMRRWSWAGTGTHQDPGSGVSWQNIATDVLPGGAGAPATYPFTRTLATTDTPYQRLLLELQVGHDAWGSESTSTNTFIARNSSATSVTNVGGVVCNGGGTVERP